MKRVLREWFRQHKHELAAVDIIIRVRQPFRHSDYAVVINNLQQLLSAAGVHKTTQ